MRSRRARRPVIRVRVRVGARATEGEGDATSSSTAMSHARKPTSLPLKALDFQHGEANESSGSG